MPGAPLAAAEMRRRVKAWRDHGRNQQQAAEALGLTTPTMRHTLIQAIRRKLITKSEMTIAAAVATQRTTRTVDIGADRKSFEKQIADLTAQVERMRNARTVTPIRVSTHRPDDFVRVFVPDSHGAHADPAAVGAFLADLKALNPHEVVMLGDHVDCGGFLALHHTLGYVAESTYTYEDDIRATNDFLDAIQKAAPRARIHYIEGNHEARVEKWCLTVTLRSGRDAEGLRQRNAPEFLLRLKERGIPYYRRAMRYDGLPIPGCIKLGKTFVIHEPGRGGRPEQYARQFGGCVVHGHEHRARSAVVRTVAAGEIGAWCPGTLAVQQPYYFHTNLTDHSHGHLVQNVSRSGGFLMVLVPIINGVSHLTPLLGRH